MIVGLAIVALAVTALFVSIRRNKRVIDSFDHNGISQLKLCLSDWRLPAAKKKLAKLGWRFVRSEKQSVGQSYVWFEQTDDGEAVPLNEVLHSLNRAGYLSVAPLTLEKEDARPTS